jgi:hypothetical protein
MTASRAVLFGQNAVKKSELVERARVAIEKKADFGIRLLQAGFDQLIRQRIWHVVARVDDRGDLLAEIGLVLDVRAEYVAGCDSRDTEGGGDLHRLGSLTGAGGTDDKQTSHRAKLSTAGLH